MPAAASSDNDLYTSVKNYAKARGYRLRPGATSWLRESTAALLTKGVDQNVALEAYKKLVDVMIQQSKTIPNYAPGGLGERTLFPALSKLCPLFPIC